VFGLLHVLATETAHGDQKECVRKDPLPTETEWEVRELVVIDRAACLMWTRGDFKTLTGSFAKSWDEAMRWAPDMNDAVYAGYGDWRVASIAEYRTISGRFTYSKAFYSDDEYAFWSRNEINRWVASYYIFKKRAATSGAKSERADLPKPWKFSARLVRALP
jgi:hypothetical protein